MLETCVSQQKGDLQTSFFKGDGNVGNCVFPFTYASDDTTYTSCAEVEDYGGVGWCAFDARDYSSSRWGYCTQNCPIGKTNLLKFEILSKININCIILSIQKFSFLTFLRLTDLGPING